jgi:hypothetical protein
MSYDAKQLAEMLMKLNNSTEVLSRVVMKMKSSENTVVEDIEKLIDGAKLEPQFDIVKMSDLANDLRSDVAAAEDYADSARGNLDDIDSCVSGALSYTEDLCSMIDDIKYELKKDDESEGSGE